MCLFMPQLLTPPSPPAPLLPQPCRQVLPGLAPLLDLMGQIARRRGKSLSQVAVNWCICQVGALPRVRVAAAAMHGLHARPATPAAAAGAAAAAGVHSSRACLSLHHAAGHHPHPWRQGPAAGQGEPGGPGLAAQVGTLLAGRQQDWQCLGGGSGLTELGRAHAAPWPLTPRCCCPLPLSPLPPRRSEGEVRALNEAADRVPRAMQQNIFMTK